MSAQRRGSAGAAGMLWRVRCGGKLLAAALLAAWASSALQSSVPEINTSVCTDIN